MITPDPRGFPRQSRLVAADNSGTGCDLATLFPSRLVRKKPRKVATEQVARATCTTETDEAKKLLYEFVRNGIQEKAALTHAECKATVRYGATEFFFRATSLGQTVLDSRDKSRRSICYVRRELERLLGDFAVAADICAQLVAVQQPSSTAPRRTSAPDPTFERPPEKRSEFHWKPMDEKLALEQRVSRLATA